VADVTIAPGRMTHVEAVTWMPCGNKVTYDSRKSKKLYEAITYELDLGFEHGDSCWKSLDEQKMTLTLRRGLDMVKEKKNVLPNPVRRYLGGRVCYNKNHCIDISSGK
jgi:hypothetical protein